MPTPPVNLKTFHVYRLENGEWKFWFNGRGKSAADLKRRVSWRRKEIPYDHIKVVNPDEKP